MNDVVCVPFGPLCARFFIPRQLNAPFIFRVNFLFVKCCLAHLKARGRYLWSCKFCCLPHIICSFENEIHSKSIILIADHCWKLPSKYKKIYLIIVVKLFERNQFSDKYCLRFTRILIMCKTFAATRTLRMPNLFNNLTIEIHQLKYVHMSLFLLTSHPSFYKIIKFNTA